MQSEKDYKERLRLAEQQYKLAGILDKQIFSENIRGANENDGTPTQYSHAPNEF
jgi:hypothetical protein